MKVGVDTGGTFTDVVADDGDDRQGAVDTPTIPGARLRDGTRTGGDGRSDRRWPTARRSPPTPCSSGAGAPVALVTNAGFADVIEIARQDRPSLYDPFVDRPPPLVPRDLRFEVARPARRRRHRVEPVDRVDAAGDPTPASTRSRCACCTPTSTRAHERAVAARGSSAGFDVTCSHEVSPEFREYERTVTTVVNAYLRPVCRAVPAAARRRPPTRCW